MAEPAVTLSEGEGVTVLHFSRGDLRELLALPMAEWEGLVVLTTEADRRVLSGPVGDTAAEGLMDELTLTGGVAVLAGPEGLSADQLAYLQDRLAHMFAVEEFNTGPLSQRLHQHLLPRDRARADEVLLTALRLAEDDLEAGLFRWGKEDLTGDLPVLTLPLRGEVEP